MHDASRRGPVSTEDRCRLFLVLVAVLTVGPALLVGIALCAFNEAAPPAPSGTVLSASPLGAVAVRSTLAAEPLSSSPPPQQACRHRDPRIGRLAPRQVVAANWPKRRLRYADAWLYSRGEGVVVAVVDSGVDGHHEQLKGAVWTGWDITSGVAVPGADTDCAAHGTQVAGILAARKLPGRAMSGIAPGATVLPIRESWGIGARGEDVKGDVGSLLQAMGLAVRSGARIVNVSVTVAEASLREDQRAAFNQIARDAADRQVLIVAASGNRDQYEGQNLSTYPAALAADHQNVIAVAGIDSSGLPDKNAITGPFVTVAAPSQGVPCTMDRGGTVLCNGTSFAAPFVSGLAALVRSRSPNLTAAEVRTQIAMTADHPSTDLPDPALGYGVVNPLAALTSKVPPETAETAVGSRATPYVAPPEPDPALRRRALAAGAGALVGGGLIIAVAQVLPAGRRRRWRPGLRVSSDTGTVYRR